MTRPDPVDLLAEALAKSVWVNAPVEQAKPLAKAFAATTPGATLLDAARLGAGAGRVAAGCDAAQAAAEAERLRAAHRHARAVATVWRDHFLNRLDDPVVSAGLVTHPMGLVLAALDGETDPVSLGCDPDEFRAALEDPTHE